MGEWFLRQKAHRSKLARAKRLEELLGPGLFDKASEKRKRLFRAVPLDGFNPGPGDFLLLTYEASGGFNLLLNVRKVAEVQGTDARHLQIYLAKLDAETGICGAIVDKIDPTDGSFLFEVER